IFSFIFIFAFLVIFLICREGYDISRASENTEGIIVYIENLNGGTQDLIIPSEEPINLDYLIKNCLIKNADSLHDEELIKEIGILSDPYEDFSIYINGKIERNSIPNVSVKPND